MGYLTGVEHIVPTEDGAFEDRRCDMLSRRGCGEPATWFCIHPQGHRTQWCDRMAKTFRRGDTVNEWVPADWLPPEERMMRLQERAGEPRRLPRHFTNRNGV
jgi:hypothetical protein